jgi:hypothetical protein
MNGSALISEDGPDFEGISIELVGPHASRLLPFPGQLGFGRLNGHIFEQHTI